MAVSVYLAGPIDDVDVDTAKLWRYQLADLFPSVLFFSPVGAWLNPSEPTAAKLDHGNRHAISACDGMLANLAGPGRGFGTIREVEFAVRLGKPVAVVADLASLLTYDVAVFETLEEAMDGLLEEFRQQRNQRPTFFGLPIQFGEPEVEDD